MNVFVHLYLPEKRFDNIVHANMFNAH